jgi:hypothetical protein
MMPARGARGALSRRVHAVAGAALGAALLVWNAGCSDDELTSVGRDTRNAPDTLYVREFTDLFADTVFAIPGSLGRAEVGQVGRRAPYTSHVLYAFRFPSWVLENNAGVTDTLRADELHFVLRMDSLTVAPFTGTMRIGVQEVAPGPPRDWARTGRIDSLLVALPQLDLAPVTPDTLLVASELAGDAVRLDFRLATAAIAGYDSVLARGDSLDIHLAVLFEGFVAAGKGFLDLPLRNPDRLAQVVVFSQDRVVAIQSPTPFRSRPVVEFDSTFAFGDKIAVSDGFRQHTFLRFAPLRRILPDSALVFAAELVLTQVDTLDGDSFSSGLVSLGVVVPNDTTQIFSQATALRPIAFATALNPVPNTSVVVPVTPYIFDIQEGNVPDRGMILRLSNEGTRVRHFEFYGGAAPDSTRRPRLRLIYGFPAGFEGGER